jgi:hypothetical protein
MEIKKELIDDLLKNYQKPAEVIGENGLLKQPTKALLERAMDAELTHRLGYEKSDPAGYNSGNSRNGTTAEYCDRIERHLESAHGIRVVTRDIPDPLTGDLDGAEIHIDCAVSPEQRLFLLAHLFGHTVQWNVDPVAFETGRPQAPPVGEGRLPAIIDYEREAACYALSMLHQIGIVDIDRWFCDYTTCDMAYLMHYYRTGEKRAFLNFWRDGTPPIEPKAVPRFVPVKRVFRLDGIVI